jgi:hypothetical protein
LLLFCPPPPQLRWCHSLDPPQPSEAIFPRVGVHPDPVSPYKITLQNACALPQRDPASQEKAGAMDKEVSACSCHSRRWLVYARWKLESSPISPLRTESLPCFLLASLGQLSTWGTPGFGLSLTYVHCPSRECCCRNSGFPHLLFCAGTIVGSCTHSRTTHSVCFHDGQCVRLTPSVALGSDG